MRRTSLRLVIVGVLMTTPVLCRADDVPAEQVLHVAVARADRTWERVTTLHPELSSREIFTGALAWCEADVHLDRLQRLFEVAARMQDRDEESRGYGNFHWRWREGAVLDYNAVEFSMQAATLVWIRHRDRLAPGARAELAEILRYAVEGCLRHRVPPSYTNIALMNASNLVLLGEALDLPDAAEEGYRRLEDVCVITWEGGVHEYCSPTYYGVDLEDLAILTAFCRREEGRRQAQALLDLLWQDIALNWFHPAERLAGARSRDYDYLHGLGYLDTHMWPAGWLEGDPTGNIYTVVAPTSPPDDLLALSRTHLPRLVRQRWGTALPETRTHYMLADVTLSCSGAGYGRTDMPLTVDLPGSRYRVRGYFIADGRRDPYGKKRIPAGPHEKALHLAPLFCGAQRTTDALGLVIYRPGDLPPDPPTLESHFVLPMDVDAAWIGERSVALTDRAAFAEPLEPGDALVLRCGTAAIGLRVPWARGLDGGGARVALVYDGNEYGAMRLTVAHHSFWGIQRADSNPGAAFWVRVGGGLADDAAFEAWRADFASAQVHTDVTDDLLRIEVAGTEGPVAVATAPPFLGCGEIVPAPDDALLELDGKDIGRALLANLEVIRRYEQRKAAGDNAIQVLAEGWYFEAESGALVPAMRVGEDEDASGGAFIWMPGKAGERTSGYGSATWQIDIPEAGDYYLWGRVLAPTPSDDSFYLRVFTATGEPVGRSDWHTGVHENWEWVPVTLAKSTEPAALPLPAGRVGIELSVREDGTKIDRLFLTPYMDQEPK
ncbi:MAG: hypothetical protein J7M38_15550 [Armatimonadetes bacterium]|nr:hypothetical protein [Armatimonadota bacterium]